MTVAHLKERMDGRFKAVDKRFDAVDQRFDAVDTRFDQMTARMDADFRSIGDKLNTILTVVDRHYRHQQKILDEHDDRLKDLEPPPV